jgi:hypothetical protein
MCIALQCEHDLSDALVVKEPCDYSDSLTRCGGHRSVAVPAAECHSAQRSNTMNLHYHD